MTRILKYIPIIGQKYFDWTIVSDQVFKKDSNRGTYWKVQCKCGRESLKLAQHIVQGRGKCCKSCSKTTTFKDSFALAYMNRIIKRAEKINVEYNLNPEYLYELFLLQDKKCALSGVDIQFSNSWNSKSNQTASLDRIDNTQGYIIGNVQWVHKDVNFMKGKLSEERFIELCQLISSKCG